MGEEVASGSERGKNLTSIMESGQLVPLATVLDLLAEAMIKRLSGSKGFLIDGYPREVAQGEEFEEAIKKRLVTFHQHSEPVIKHYASKCSVIPAERGIDEIFADVASALDKM